jgi:hypothetical protein
MADRADEAVSEIDVPKAGDWGEHDGVRIEVDYLTNVWQYRFQQEPIVGRQRNMMAHF